MDMVLTKIGRITTGDLNEDNFKDAAGYLELAYLAKTDPSKIPGKKS
jgi:hypothetical protein